MKATKRSIHELLIEHSPFRRSGIKRRLIREEILPYKCSGCTNNGTWKEQPLSLQLEHKNGINDDYRLENLTFLCPNCHSQTPTFAGRNSNKAGTLQDIRKYGARSQYREATKIQYEQSQQKYIRLVEKSKIDFSNMGWVKRVGTLIEQPPSQVKHWMLRFMPNFYTDKCYKRKPRTLTLRLRQDA